jgi:hypothetical protein
MKEIPQNQNRYYPVQYALSTAATTIDPTPRPRDHVVVSNDVGETRAHQERSYVVMVENWHNDPTPMEYKVVLYLSGCVSDDDDEVTSRVKIGRQGELERSKL